MPSWQRLKRLRIAWFVSMGAFILYGYLTYQYGIGTIERIQGRFGLSNDWMPLFVFPVLIPTAVITVMIRRFKCPECNGRFVRGSLFRSSCASCGTSPK